MEYFQILNMQKEPFSNSPEPDFFFQSDQHQACLQKLELALRLRRGLNIVMGEVGTGKTTLCRRLILNLSEAEEDKNNIETHLILDPSFSNAQEFLASVASLFGIAPTNAEMSEWQLKEAIKNYLFHRGVDDNKTVILIIDEGQKIPEFCLEILREFLNYETNEYKLLQIVIFAQKEFEETLRERKNFTDRVNQYTILEPLNFWNCRQMINYRMAKASTDNSSASHMFTLLALWAVHRATGGYPRRIITLCHQVMLTMIIQNRTRAGFFLVRSCAGRVNPLKAPFQAPFQGLHWPRWAAYFAGACVLLFLIVNNYEKIDISPAIRQDAANIKQIHNSPAKATINAESSAMPTAAEAKLQPAVSPVPPVASVGERSDKEPAKMKIPDMLGQLIVEKNDCVSKMLERLYGREVIYRLDAVRRVNPQIRDINWIKKGDIVTVPILRSKDNPLPAGKYWLQVATPANLPEAYKFMTENNQLPRLLLHTYWNKNEGTVYSVLLKEGFNSESAADAFIKTLPSALASKARVISGWPDGTVYL
jgi:general secretion pathway protein A